MIYCNLKAILESQRLSIGEAAEKCAIHRNSISRLVNNSTERIDYSTIEAVCRGLGIGIEELLVLDPPLATK